MNIIFNLFCFLPFLRFSYTDLRRQKVYNSEICIAWLMIFGTKMIVCNFWQIALSFLISICILIILIFVVLIAESIFGKYLFGGGDIKLVALLAWSFDLTIVFHAVKISCCLAIGFLLLKKIFLNSERILIPFAPFLTAGILFSLLLQHYLLLSKI
ncbi:MAG: hypothetical protein GX217_02035 [Clostridiaceae bacterium]|nr:hypothetical protein [Clostridiaceae bacterium]